jgi:hypothetical protein
MAASHFLVLFGAALLGSDTLLQLSPKPLREAPHWRASIGQPCLDLRFSRSIRFDESEFAADHAGTLKANFGNL